MRNIYDAFDAQTDECFALQLKGVEALWLNPNRVSERKRRAVKPVESDKFTRQKPKYSFHERWMKEIWGEDPKNWPQWMINLQNKARQYLERTQKNHRTSA